MCGGGAQGFSLLEVLVAQALLSVGLLSVAQLFGVAMLRNTDARVQSLAVTLAQGKMESLRAHSAAGGAPGSGEETVYILPLEREGVRSVLASFQLIWAVQLEPRGAYVMQVKIIPGADSRRPAGAIWSPVLIFRAGVAPLRR